MLNSKSSGGGATASAEAKLAVLDIISTNVMLADADRNIVYMNKSVESFLRSAERDIQKDLPHFKVSELVGKNIDIFHKNPEYQKQMLDKLSGTYKTSINVGGRMFDLVASPVFDKKGKRIGTFVEWLDAALRLQNIEYTALADALSKSQAIIEFKPDGTIVNANENFLAAMGYSLQELKGQHHRMFVESSYASSREYKDFWEALNRNQYQAGEYKRLGKGNKEIWIQASYNPIADEKGKVFKVVKYATDITDQVRKRTETQRVTQTINESLDKISSEVGSANKQAANSSSQTLATVQAVAAAVEELSSSIGEISQSVTTSKNAVNVAIKQTDDADKATQDLAKNAESMSGIVALIQNIAGQINLLALNATIESARAGDAGRGFAVVANEVKSLATQVAGATEQISKQIDNMQKVSDEVVGALGTIKQSVESVVSSVTGVASAIEEQSVVTNDISANMQQASGLVGSLNSNIGDIDKAVVFATKISEEVRENLKRLAG